MTILLAGHPMIDRGAGLFCPECGQTWAFLLDNRDRWKPGVMGLAHNDAGTVGLNVIEIGQMERYLDWITACLSASRR